MLFERKSATLFVMKHIGVFCAASQRLEAAYYDEALRVGHKIGQMGWALVYGGANSGSMECVAQGVHEAGGTVVGVVPRILETKRRASDYIDELVPCTDLNDRKQIMIERSDVLLALPGGVGTLDEIFTLMAANSIGYQQKPIVLYNESGFWNSLLALLEEYDRKSFINVPCSNYLKVVSSVQELEELLNECSK